MERKASLASATGKAALCMRWQTKAPALPAHCTTPSLCNLLHSSMLSDCLSVVSLAELEPTGKLVA